VFGELLREGFGCLARQVGQRDNKSMGNNERLLLKSKALVMQCYTGGFLSRTQFGPAVSHSSSSLDHAKSQSNEAWQFLAFNYRSL
jgi:hypothetical protein